ncbi:MAG: hypothetical protein ACF8XB_10815, partial [Planctomycetota bacterium JB042]
LLLAAPGGEAVLTSTVETARFRVHARPGSRAEASLDRVATLAERDLDTILAALEFRWTGERIRLFLYDDVPELQEITGVGASGYSVPLESHVPHDNDQTRLHELVHVVAERLPEKGPEERNLFSAEGLANAILEFVHGVPVHAVAAYYREEGKLPSITEMLGTEDFYSWLGAHPGFNGYDVAGSFYRHLLDTYDAKRVRRFYRGVPAKKAFGKDLDRIEAEWHAALDAVELNDGLRRLLAERDGQEVAYTEYVGPDATLDAATLGPAEEWRRLDGAALEESGGGRWKKEGSAIRGEGPRDSGDWSHAFLGADRFGDCMIRARVRPDGGCWGAKVQLGDSCQAIVLGNGAFLYTEDGGVAHDGNAKLGAEAVELVLRRVGTEATVWLDGRKVLDGNVGAGEARVTLGVVQGAARFEEVRVRPL